MQPPLIPYPREVHTHPGAFALNSARAIYLLAPLTEAQGAKSIATRLASALDGRTAFRLPVLLDIQHEPAMPEGSIRLRLDPGCSEPGDEGYVLEVNDHTVSITARHPAGLFYGTQTLLNSVTPDGTQQSRHLVPCMTVRDAPRFPWRGFMLDSARHLQTVDEIKQLIQTLASLKYNCLHWHLSDDQGWRLAINSYPQLTEKGAWRGKGTNRYGGYYTHAQVREIVQFANEHYITVVPEIDLPGHCNAALHAYPELSCTGEPVKVDDEGGLDTFTKHDGRRLFCAGNDKALAFLKDVMAEVADVFKSPYIHLGGDERPEGIWEACPHCKQRMDELKLQNEDELELWLTQQVATYVQDTLGVQVIGWGDNLKKAGMPKGQIVQGWLEGQAEMAASQGRATINSFHEWVYLDYPETDAGRVGKPDWMPLLPVEKVYGFEPIPAGLDPDQHHRVLGGEAPIWTEYIPNYEALVKQVLPRMTALSEVLWTPMDRRDFKDFTRRAEAVAAAGAAAAPQSLKPAQKSGFDRKKLDIQAVES